MIICSHFVRSGTTIYIHDTPDSAEHSNHAHDIHVCLSDSSVYCGDLDCQQCPLSDCDPSGVLPYLIAEDSPLLQTHPELVL